MSEEVYISTEFPQVIIGKKEVFFTPQEFKIFNFLWKHRNLTVTRSMLLQEVWFFNGPNVETRVVDVYVGYVRNKLSETILSEAIQSFRGFGYRLVYAMKQAENQCGCICIHCKNCFGKEVMSV